MPETDLRGLILQFIGSLTLDEHMGDVCDTVETVLKRLGVEVGEWNDMNELGTELAKIGVTTLHGTSLRDEDE